MSNKKYHHRKYGRRNIPCIIIQPELSDASAQRNIAITQSLARNSIAYYQRIVDAENALKEASTALDKAYTRMFKTDPKKDPSYKSHMREAAEWLARKSGGRTVGVFAEPTGNKALSGWRNAVIDYVRASRSLDHVVHEANKVIAARKSLAA